jgi:hypothetical protein
MCRQLCLIVLMLFAASVAGAEDVPNPDQLKKAYDDALVQLKDAQNSKNELAKANDQLGKQVEDLKKQLSASQRKLQDLERQVAENDEKTFQLRSFYAAWHAFLDSHPQVLGQWKRYIRFDTLAIPQEPLPLIDLGSPLVEQYGPVGRG